MSRTVVHNSEDLWESLWERGIGPADEPETYQQELQSVRWRRVRDLTLTHFGKVQGLRVVELGSGIGTYGALFAALGARVTLVDYSEAALKQAQHFFDSLGLGAKYIKADLFHLPNDFETDFDISISCGVAEHFLGKKRIKILDIHREVIKHKGLSFILVPNNANLPYRIYKNITEKLGLWPWGEEYPYTRGELEEYCKARNVHHYGFLGDSFLWSLNHLNPFCLLSKKIPYFRRLHFPQTIATPFDSLYSYSIGLWLEKD